MQPFRVVFTLGTPVCINHPWLHLDGIIAHLKYEARLQREYRYLPSKAVVTQADRDRPVFKKTNGIRHASVSVFAPDVPMFTQAFFKRFEPENYPGRNRVNIGSGHYRNYMMRAVLVPCERVEFYGFGEIDVVRGYLETLTHLGNDGRIGHGRILSVSVEPVEQDLSLVAHGIAMRPIPTHALRKWSDAVPLAWHAPYWAASSISVCAPPGAEVVLK
jgi:hypothetical protein